MVYLTDIAAYFQYLCEQHPLLLHSETSGQRVFEVKAYEQAFGDFRTGVKPKDYFVRMILPSITFMNHGSSAKKWYQGGLLVGRWYSRAESDKATQMAAYSAAEKVADEFVARMVADSRNGHPVFANSIDQVENLKINGDFIQGEGDLSYSAVLYLFDFGTFRGLDADCQSITWADGGLTPIV